MAANGGRILNCEARRGCHCARGVGWVFRFRERIIKFFLVYTVRNGDGLVSGFYFSFFFFFQHSWGGCAITVVFQMAMGDAMI